MRKMKLSLYTPHRHFPSVECDSVILCIADSISGNFSGSYGIRKGHAKAVFSLSQGRITASLKGQEVFSVECLGGFAKVENDEVTVTVCGTDE